MLSPSAIADKAAGTKVDLAACGLQYPGKVYAGLAAAPLVECALERKEGVLAANGALVAVTGARTGRSPKDRYLVAESSSRDAIWWGPVNRPMQSDVFERLHHRMLAYLQ